MVHCNSVCRVVAVHDSLTELWPAGTPSVRTPQLAAVVTEPLQRSRTAAGGYRFFPETIVDYKLQPGQGLSCSAVYTR